jgi:hypothetical protein
VSSRVPNPVQRNARVETHVKGTFADAPLHFWIGSIRFEAIDLEDRWSDPAGLYFRVFADDSERYIIRHDAASGLWDIWHVKR